MPIAIELIAGATGLPLTQVAEDIGHAKDPLVPGFISEEVAMSYIRDVKRSQERHRLLVEAYEAAQAAHGEKATEVYQQALEAAYRANKQQLRQSRGQGIGNPGDEKPFTGKRLKEEAFRMAHKPAQEAFDEWQAQNQFPPFERWAQSIEGRAAAKRIEKQLAQLEAAAA